MHITKLGTALLLGAALSAQTILVPQQANGGDLNGQTSQYPGNQHPISGAGNACRTLSIYDSANFINQGLSSPVLITQLRIRANGSTQTWTGATISNLIIDMSTTPHDWTSMSRFFNQNHGGDRTTVYNNSLTINPGSLVGPTVGGFELTIPLNPPFAYQPALGDLTIDYQCAGYAAPPVWIQMVPTMDTSTTAGIALGRHMHTNAGQFATDLGFNPSGQLAMVIEFTTTPVTTNLAAFTATPRNGLSPLQVQFTDQSYSPAPGGITSWQWDFENDGIVDSNLQSPQHTYPCGNWTVRLTVDDGVNGPASVVRNNLIVTDEIVPSFTFSSAAAGIVQFTDTTTPAATNWAWDFDGDNVTDSTLQNPTWNYNDVLPHTARLTVQRNCGPLATTTNRLVSAPGLETTYAGGQGGATNWMNMFDLTVTNPLGVEIRALDLRTNVGVGTPFNVDIYVTPGTCVGNEANSLVWRRVAQGNGVSGGNSTSAGLVRSFVNLSNGIYLAPGSYGFAIHHVSGAGQTYSTTGTNMFSNADLSFSNSRVRAGFFTGSLFTNGIWNGTLYYATSNTSNEASYGFFGLGCAGTMGVPGNKGLTEPLLNTSVTARFTNLPTDSLFVNIGFSRTTSIFGPLPLDLTPYGMPGCSGLVSTDSSLFYIGTGNEYVWSMFIPNNPMFLSAQLYTQAIVLDPAANAAGATVSDAAALVVGQ